MGDDEPPAKRRAESQPVSAVGGPICMQSTAAQNSNIGVSTLSTQSQRSASMFSGANITNFVFQLCQNPSTACLPLFEQENIDPNRLQLQPRRRRAYILDSDSD